jgi:hypothetical protein
MSDPSNQSKAFGRREALIGMSVMPLALSAKGFAQSPANSQAILAEADRIRVPQGAFQSRVGLVEYLSNKPQSSVNLTVLSKIDPQTRDFKTLVKYTSPARDVGKVVLFNGTNLWFFDPSSKATVRISPQQRLIGQAANGDVVTTNLAADYSATIVGTVAMQGADKVSRDCWQLELRPSGSTAIYGRIELWVERTTSRPVKGRFYAASGRLLKIAFYTSYKPVLGVERPTQVILIDALDARAATVVTSSEFVGKSIPDTWFQRDYLSQIR